jgi:glycosyltransferase involved in cell wall biosynthesis
MNGRCEPNQIVYVGRFQPVKGVDILLHAFRLLLNHRPEARLVLVGGSLYNTNDEQQIRKLAQELEVGKSVHFAGIKAPKEVAEIVSKSAVFVLASRRDTFPTVLVEALACGTPVVATRCGGPEDIINEKVGALVPVEDPEALADTLGNVLAQRDRFDSTRIQAYARENFSWDVIAPQVVSLYSEAIDRFQQRRD